MSQEPEDTLRKSLDAVDRHRRRLMWLLAIAGRHGGVGVLSARPRSSQAVTCRQ